MQKRKLGNCGLQVSSIGLGCMGMNFSYYPFPEKKDAINLIHKAVEQGVTFFDNRSNGKVNRALISCPY